MSRVNASTPAIVAVILCTAFGPSVFLLMPLYVGMLQETLSVGESDLGLVASADLIGTALVSFLAPLWINRVNWRRAALGCFAGLIVCNLVSMSLVSLVPLLVVRLLAGLFYGCIAALCVGVLSHSQYPARHSGLLVLVQVLYQSVAFLVLPDVIERTGMMGFMASVVAVQCVAFVSLFYFPRQPLVTTEGESHQLAKGDSRPALFLLAGIVCFFIGQTSIWAFIELIGNDMALDDRAIGIALAVSTFLALLGPIWATWAQDRYGHFQPILVAGIMQLTALLILWFVDTLVLFTGALAIFQIFWTMAIAYQYAALIRADQSNRLVAILPAAQCVGIAAGPILGGVALESVGSSGVYLITGIALLVYLALSLPYLRWRIVVAES